MLEGFARQGHILPSPEHRMEGCTRKLCAAVRRFVAGANKHSNWVLNPLHYSPKNEE